jgi:hypothetical protein
MLCDWWNHNGNIIVIWSKVGNDVLSSSLGFTCIPFSFVIWSLGLSGHGLIPFVCFLLSHAFKFQRWYSKWGPIWVKMNHLDQGSKQTFPWVGPLVMSRLDVPRPIQLWKIIGNILINIFISFLMTTFIKFHRFWNLKNINNIVCFDVPNHYI